MDILYVLHVILIFMGMRWMSENIAELRNRQRIRTARIAHTFFAPFWDVFLTRPGRGKRRLPRSSRRSLGHFIHAECWRLVSSRAV